MESLKRHRRLRPGDDAPPLDHDVGLRLGWSASPTGVTYWINVTNLTNQSVDFEGRFVVLN